MFQYWHLERLRLELIALRRLEGDYRRVIAATDVDALLKLRQKVLQENPDVTYTKYLDFEKFIPVSLKRAYALGLHNAEPAKILDIGTGSGFFPLVCKSFGHNTEAMDIDTYAVFNDVIPILGIKRTVGAVTAYSPLPNFSHKFDLVTAFRVAFNKQSNDSGEAWYWREDEWDFFLRDIASNVLTQKARLFLDLNPEKDGSYYTRELRRFFEQHGAKIARRLIYFDTMKAFS